MKQINYTGSSKLISRIVNLLNRKAPLPLDGDGDPDWGTNGQVLSTDGNGNTTWVNQGGGGSGGHTIWGRLKATLTQRSRLWFADANASDASADNATKVEVVTELANETAFDNLATDGTEDGIYAFPDSGGEYLTAAMSSYDNTASGLSATDVQDAIDEVANGVYAAGTGIDITSKSISANVKSSTLSTESVNTRTSVNNREYAVELDRDGYLAVNVPWVAQQQADWNESSSSSKSYIQNKPTIQIGSYPTSGITAGAEINVTVQFGSAFTNVPAVVVTPICDYGYGGYLCGHLKSVSKTQFVYCIKNTASLNLPLTLDWIAIAY